MAVTHADLAPSRKSSELGSKTGVFLMVLTILCGLFCFVLCLYAEASRSEATWLESDAHKGKQNEECVYSGSGKTPLVCSASAFLLLAVAMVMDHIYLLVAVSNSPPPAVLIWDPNSTLAKVLTWQAGFFFISTWVCFTVGEILLLIGLSVESGHLKKWSLPKPSCLVIGQGLFAAAGVFGLATVFFGAGLYITALRVQRLCKEQEVIRQEVMAASALYASPPASPHHHVGADILTTGNPTSFAQNQEQAQNLSKKSGLV